MRADSAKGTLMLGAVVTVRRQRDRKTITPEELGRRLSPDTIAVLDQRIDIAAWYPIHVFCELVDLDWEISGHRDPLYLERQGAMTADRLFDSGLYQQLEYAERSGKVDTRRSLERQAKLITTITGTFYSFLTSKVEVHPAALEITYGNAVAFSDALVHTTVGFMNQINLRQGSKRSWSARRAAADTVVFTMALPPRLAE